MIHFHFLSSSIVFGLRLHTCSDVGQIEKIEPKSTKTETLEKKKKIKTTENF